MKVGFPRSVLTRYGCILVSVVGWLAAGITAASEPVRVMSFNIRHDNPQDGENAWPHRRDWVAELIRENRVDVVGMQEVLKSQIDVLILYSSVPPGKSTHIASWAISGGPFRLRPFAGVGGAFAVRSTGS